MPERKPHKGLGRGLDALFTGDIPSQKAETTNSAKSEYGAMLVPLISVEPNPFQPRKDFNDEEIDELARNIGAFGVISPIVVRPKGDKYEIVTGERRLRAAKKAGMKEISAIVREINDNQMLEFALIENVQRKDLNAIELANAFKSLCETLHLTAGEIADRVGKKRETVSNYMRLLQLEGEIQEKVAQGEISFGHARALLAIDDPVRRKLVADLVAKEGISVRQVEKFASGRGALKGVAFFAEDKRKPPYIQDLEGKFQEKLGTKVVIRERKGRGKIVIEFYTHEDFERIMKIIGVKTGDF